MENKALNGLTAILLVVLFFLAGTIFDLLQYNSILESEYNTCQENLNNVIKINNENNNECIRTQEQLENRINELTTAINEEKYCSQSVYFQYEYSYTEVEQIAQEIVSDYEYNNTFRCYQFSKELQKRLKDIGYQSRIVLGYHYDSPEKENGEYHAWLEVLMPIESTSGFAVTMENYHKYYVRSEYEPWN
jgi:hypothetical protein